MPHFLFAYCGGKQPDTPKETEVEIERWRGWFARIGPAIVGAVNPDGAARTVSAEGVTDSGGNDPLYGYTIIYAKNFDQAIKLAKVCPIIGNGSIEVAKIQVVSM